MTKPINESNAARIRAALDILSESTVEVSLEAPVQVDEAEEVEETEEVTEAAEHDLDEKQESKGELYEPEASMPGKAAAKVRYTPAKAGDQPMIENELLKSFHQYVAEAEAKEANEASDKDESED